MCGFLSKKGKLIVVYLLQIPPSLLQIVIAFAAVYTGSLIVLFGTDKCELQLLNIMCMHMAAWFLAFEGGLIVKYTEERRQR